MSKPTAKKASKKNQRVKLSKKKVAAERVKLRAQRKELSEKELAAKAADPKLQPIKVSAQRKLEHNNQILRALQEEYEKEFGRVLVTEEINLMSAPIE